MHRINLRGPWRAAVEAADYTLRRNFHAPPQLDHSRERMRLWLKLAPGVQPPQVQLNGGPVQLAWETPPAGGTLGVLGQGDISAILAAYNSLALSWSVPDAAAATLPQGELKLSPAPPHPLLLDVWLEIDER